MEGTRILRNSQIIVLGLCISLATIASSLILSQGFMKIMKFTREVVGVTGSAQQTITSDLAVWQIEFSRRETDPAIAYRELESDLSRVKKYLSSKGVLEQEIAISQVFTATLFKKNNEGYDTNEVEGHRLSQRITVRSRDVQRVTAVARDITELIKEGIYLASFAPEYFYTKLDDLKVEMLARATENAKQRAESMAGSTGNRIGVIRSAKMGVFQITPPTSTEVSDYGENDTSSLEKKVMAVVSVTFSIE
ncbi:MAG: SIMPL domain-containing protein [Verrucomicrobiota bacterium]